MLFRIFQVLLALFVAGTLSCTAIGLYYVHTVIKKAPAVSDVTVSPGSAATYIYSQSGKREQKLTLPEANRDLVTILNVPIDLQHAFVAVEDARFYQHNGIDPKGIIRAFWHGVTTGRFDEGASTITQQLLKNTVFTSWTTEKSFLDRLDRKIQEQYLAIQLEKVMTKDQIMEDYLNVINLGAGCYGVQSAAFRYFGKDVSELTLSECAVIAGITQNPTFYNPITYPDNNNGKRRTVLNLMLAQGYITEAQRDEALADPVYERIQSNEDTKASEVSVYTYYQDALIDQVIEDLMNERGFTYKQAVKAVYAGGLRIYSAQDPSIQQICDEEFANPSNFPEGTEAGIDYALSIESSSGEVTHYGNEDLISYMRKTADPRFNLMLSTDAQARECADAFKASVLKEGDTVLGERVTITPQPQASVTIIDPETGYVRALVGGRGTKEASLTLNRASYTTRQPGSTFKILTTYAPAIDSCSKTLASVYDNTAYTYEDGTPVNNWDLQTTSGPVTIRQAITESINIVAVRCITEITPRLGFSYAKAMGISSLVENYNNGSEVLTDVTQSLALGGITLGVTNLELCSAYACIANSGMYIAPKFYTKVLDTYGNTILDNTAPASQAVLKSSTAALLTSAMEDVIADPSGTAYGSISLKDMPVAGKSGTTSDYRDIWFAGFTPYYACCVWGGYDNNAALPDSGLYHSYNKVLWNSIMNRIHEGLAPRSFYVPSDVVSAEICDTTGMAATTGCPAHHSELFSTDTQPMYYCNVHGNGGIVSGIVLPQSAFTDTNGQGNDIVIIQDGSNTWTFTPGESTVIDTGNTLVPDGSSSENALFPDNSPSGNTLVPDDSSLSPEVIEILNGIPEPH